MRVIDYPNIQCMYSLILRLGRTDMSLAGTVNQTQGYHNTKKDSPSPVFWYSVSGTAGLMVELPVRLSGRHDLLRLRVRDQSSTASAPW